MSGRAEPIGNALTSQRTPQPTTPAGQAVVSAVATGSMGVFRSRPYMDCSSLRAESPGLIGTAVCGPARTVVWQPGLA
jgi:hypothetical protein